MFDFVLSMDYYHWFIFGLLFFIIEILSFTTFFLFLGISSILVGIINWGFGTSGEFDLIMFSVLSIISLVMAYVYLQKKGEHGTNMMLNDRSQAYVGRKITLSHDIPSGESRISIDDSLWKVRADRSYKRGDIIEVKSISGSVFIVEGAK